MEKIKKYVHLVLFTIAMASCVTFVVTFIIDEVAPQPEVKMAMYVSGLMLGGSVIALAEKF